MSEVSFVRASSPFLVLSAVITLSEPQGHPTYYSSSLNSCIFLSAVRANNCTGRWFFCCLLSWWARQLPSSRPSSLRAGPLTQTPRNDFSARSGL